MTIIFYVDLDKILERKRMTLSQLSVATGLSTGALSNIRRTKTISMSSLSKIATGLGEKDLTALLEMKLEEKTKS